MQGMHVDPSTPIYAIAIAKIKVQRQCYRWIVCYVFISAMATETFSSSSAINYVTFSGNRKRIISRFPSSASASLSFFLLSYFHGCTCEENEEG